MKTFIITHNLVAGSGFIITAVKANDELEAWSKYKEEYPHRWHLGMSIIEVTEDVQEVYRYDNPAYEG